jgi:hypothetical protein
VGVFIGKAASPLSFVEAVHLSSTIPALGDRALVPSAEAEGNRVEKFLPLGRSGTTVW